MAWIIRGSNPAVPSIASPNYLSVTATFTAATWNTAATHEVFTVTGLVRMRMWIECTGTLTDAADGAAIQFGHEAASNAFIASTLCARAGTGLLSTGCLWIDATPLTTPDTNANVVLDYIVNGSDIGYEITGAALTGGSLVFHCAWDALNATGNVVAGAGGALA
jgi:hypothetical protein